jgi:hypothetical protein
MRVVYGDLVDGRATADPGDKLVNKAPCNPTRRTTLSDETIPSISSLRASAMTMWRSISERDRASIEPICQSVLTWSFMDASKNDAL